MKKKMRRTIEKKKEEYDSMYMFTKGIESGEITKG